MNNRFWLRSLQAAAVSASVLVAYPSQAAIMGWSIQGGLITEPENQTNLDIQIIDPPPETLSLRAFPFKTTNPDLNRNVQALIEKQNVSLMEDVVVWDEFNPVSGPITLPQNTKVSSQLFYFNPPGNGRYSWSGEITFDTKILGIISGWRNTPPGFEPTNNLLGLDDVIYDVRSTLDGPYSGTGNRGDRDTLIFDNNTLSFVVTGRWGTEPFRVITEATAAPEPLTILGSLGAVGFGTWFRKVRSKAESKNKQGK